MEVPLGISAPSFIDRTKQILSIKPVEVSIKGTRYSTPHVKNLAINYPKIVVTLFAGMQNERIVEVKLPDLTHKEQYKWKNGKVNSTPGLHKIQTRGKTTQLNNGNQTTFGNGNHFLPQEVLRLIFSYIHPSELATLKRTCHAWNRMLAEHQATLLVRLAKHPEPTESLPKFYLGIQSDTGATKFREFTGWWNQSYFRLEISGRYLLIHEDYTNKMELLDPTTLETLRTIEFASNLSESAKVFGDYVVIQQVNSLYVVNLNHLPKGTLESKYVFLPRSQVTAVIVNVIPPPPIEPFFKGELQCDPIIHENLLFLPRKIGTLELWNIDDKQKLHEIALDSSIDSIAFEDNKCLVAHSNQEKLFVWQHQNS